MKYFLIAKNQNKIMFRSIMNLKKATTKRISSWEKNGKNSDYWDIQPGETRTIADIKGPGLITHLWMTQGRHYRDVLIKISWDDAEKPSVLCPLGDFYGLGHSIVNSYQSLFLTASTTKNNTFESGCALNCYFPMPFKKRAVIELINESKEVHKQYFYVDYEIYENEEQLGKDIGYFHAEFRRENPFGGWGHEVRVNSDEANIVNLERLAWDNNYVILETEGKGHYVGCNYSVSNFQGTWWGEGDDMIWVDGYKWPPDLHGTGSEDYLNQAWGMQDNAFLRNGSSIFENNTNGYQTSYVYHVENPVRFEKQIKVTIELGHGNHLRNEVSTVAYFYMEKPTGVKNPPPVDKRQRVLKRDNEWIFDTKNQITTKEVPLNEEMKIMKNRWKQKNFAKYTYTFGKTLIEDDLLSLEMKIARENPNLYVVSFSEILDEFSDEKILLQIIPKTAIYEKEWRTTPDVSKLVELPPPEVSTMGTLEFIDEKCYIISDSGKTRITDLLKDNLAKTTEIEVTKILDEELIKKGYNVLVQIRFD